MITQSTDGTFTDAQDATRTATEMAEELHYNLFRVVAALRRTEYDLIAARELTLTQCSLLYTLRRNGRSRITDLAAHERISLPRMAIATRKLVEMGLARRTRDLSDRRNIWIDITTEGIQRQRAAVDEVLELILAELDPPEIAALSAALEPLQRIAGRL